MTPSLNQVMDLVKLQLGVSRIRARDCLMADLGAESFDLLNLVALAEEQFGAILDETDLAAVETVRDFHEAIITGMEKRR